MEKQPPKPMTPFDELVNPPMLYTLKLLLPYIPLPMQRIFAIFLKFFELKNTMETFYGFDDRQMSSDSNHLFRDLKPYMNPKDQEMMDQMESMMSMMEMMQQMPKQADFSSEDECGSFSPLNLMKSMMDPEQQNMFEMYSNMFENAMNHPDSQKGE